MVPIKTELRIRLFDMQTIFITGATRGIGRETALLFARRGWRVFGCGLDESMVNEVNEIGRKENVALEIFRMDVTRPDEIERGVARVMEATGGKGPDVLVNNAGYQELGPVEDLSLDVWRAQFETNVFGYITMIQRFAPKMREQKKGRIVNVASIAGRAAFPMYGAYAASKHAIEGMSDALRMELKPFGVKVVIVEPGPMTSHINVVGYGNMAKHRPPQTAYANYYDAGNGMLERVEKNSYPTEQAAVTIFKAATVHWPRQRYGVTPLWWAVVTLKKFLPGWLQDAILRRSV